MSFWKIVLLTISILSFVYFIGRAFGQGLMDGINHKINQFHKFKKEENDNKEKAE